MPPVNIPITQVWPSGITNTGGVEWITAPTPGIDDPQPINSNIGIMFNSGSQTGLSINTLTLYLRGNSNVPTTQGVLNNQLLGSLNGYSLANSTTLPPGLQSSSIANAFNIQANIQWGNFSGTVGYQVSLQNSINSIIYQYNTITSGNILNSTQLTDNTNYLFYVSLEGSTIEVTIYPFNSEYYLLAPIFTSAPIKDSSVFYRTPGHIGIDVNMVNNGATVYSLRPYHTVFAEFESSTFNSHTPVIGAQLYAQNTPPTQLFYPPLIPVTSSDNITPTVLADSGRSTTGESSKVIFGKSTATQTYQGFTTQPLTPIGDSISGITDYNSITASFDIWIESSALTNSATPFIGLLVNDHGYGIPIQLPTIVPNKWNHSEISVLINPNVTPSVVTSNTNTVLSIPIPVQQLIPSGVYKFAILYTGSTPTTLWLDNVQITSNAVSWYGRATQDNPFTRDLAPWVPFNDTINTYNSGIRFDQPGYSLQVKAQALQQDAEIYNGYTLVPTYAQLGRFMPNRTAPSVISSNNISISSVNTSDTYTFTLTITPTVGTIFNIEWSFGDGNYAYDQWIVGRSNVSRTYTYVPGPTDIEQYYVTAAVTDNFGNKGYGTTVISI